MIHLYSAKRKGRVTNRQQFTVIADLASSTPFYKGARSRGGKMARESLVVQVIYI